MAEAFLALPSFGLAVLLFLLTLLMLLPLKTAQTVPLVLPMCREVSGGGEGGSCWADGRSALPDTCSGA